MIALSADDLADLRRWAICGAIVVIAHGALAAGMVKWREQIEPAEPAAAIVVEFAPVPVGPAVPAPQFNRSEFWAQGVNFGVEVRW